MKDCFLKPFKGCSNFVSFKVKKDILIDQGCLNRLSTIQLTS